MSTSQWTHLSLYPETPENTMKGHVCPLGIRTKRKRPSVRKESAPSVAPGGRFRLRFCHLSNCLSLIDDGGGAILDDAANVVDASLTGEEPGGLFADDVHHVTVVTLRLRDALDHGREVIHGFLCKLDRIADIASLVRLVLEHFLEILEIFVIGMDLFLAVRGESRAVHRDLIRIETQVLLRLLRQEFRDEIPGQIRIGRGGGDGHGQISAGREPDTV